MNKSGRWLTSFTMLKSFGPSCLNRSDDGEPKQQMMGGTLRARGSSAWLKRAWRKAMKDGKSFDVHTAHIQDCVEEILKEMAKTGKIKENEIDYYGAMICNQGAKSNVILDANWKKRSSLAAENDKDADVSADASAENTKGKKKKKDEDGDNGDNKSDKDKKFTITVASPEEILAVINAVIDYDKAEKEAGKKASPSELFTAAENALACIPMSLDKAMFGNMATDGAIGTVDGSVYVADAYSIDEYKPEYDYHTATFYPAVVPDGSAFFEGFNLFNKSREETKGAETIANSWLNSNTMLIQTAVNLSEFKKNLAKAVSDEDKITDMLAENVAEYAKVVATVIPESSQHSHYSKPLPDILYFEITNGEGFTVDGSFAPKIVKPTSDKGVSEIGIERILGFTRSVTDLDNYLDNSCVRKRYVFLSQNMSGYTEEFEKAGVTVLHNLSEVSGILVNEVKAVA